MEGKRLTLSLNLQPVSLGAQPEIEFQLLRIAREAIANVIAHAHATALNISLEVREQVLFLTLDDDGVGFDPAAAQRLGHYGLTGMQERGGEIGAQLTITSQPGQVTVRLPLARLPKPESTPEPVTTHQYLGKENIGKEHIGKEL